MFRIVLDAEFGLRIVGSFNLLGGGNRSTHRKHRQEAQEEP